MKKTLLAISALLVICAFFAFSWNSNPYEHLVDVEIKNEFVSSTSSDALITNLSSAFSHLFDRIDKVDVHYSEEHGYYYTVYGMYEGNAEVSLINVLEELAVNETFPTLEQMGIDQTNMAAITCYWRRVLGIWICGTTRTRNRICGYTVGGICIPFDIINR